MIKEQFFALMESPAGGTGLSVSDTLSCSPKEALFLFQSGFEASTKDNKVITDACRVFFEGRMTGPLHNLTRDGSGYLNVFTQQEWNKFADIWYSAIESTYTYKNMMEHHRLLDMAEKEYHLNQEKKKDGL